MLDFLKHNLLTILIFLPMVGAVAVLFLKNRDHIRWTAVGFTLATFVLSLLLFATFKWGQGTGYGWERDGGVVQMEQRASWIPAFNIEYLVGIDGLSFPLVILS